MSVSVKTLIRRCSTTLNTFYCNDYTSYFVYGNYVYFDMASKWFCDSDNIICINFTVSKIRIISPRAIFCRNESLIIQPTQHYKTRTSVSHDGCKRCCYVQNYTLTKDIDYNLEM